MGKLYWVADKSCNRRKEEVDHVGFFLRRNGWVLTTNRSIADLVFLYTCGLSETKVHEAEDSLAVMKKGLKDGAQVIVGGCVPSTDRESLSKVFQGITVTPTDFSALNNIKGTRHRVTKDLEFEDGSLHVDLRAWLSIINGNLYLAYEMINDNGFLKAINKQVTKLMRRIPASISSKDHSIFVAKGCPRVCTYCAIRFATGELKSKPLDKIIKEIRSASKKGKTRFELNADSIGDYGLDIGSNFGELMDALGEMKEKFTVAILDLHPVMLLKYYDQLDSLCKKGRVHTIYVPVQSANPRILELMKRHCDIEKVREKMIELKKYKDISLQGCVIVGFPGETDEEFQDSVQFLKDIDCDDNYIHIYSDMPNTESSTMTDKIDNATMRRRYEMIKDTDIKFNRTATEEELETGYNDVS